MVYKLETSLVVSGWDSAYQLVAPPPSAEGPGLVPGWKTGSRIPQLKPGIAKYINSKKKKKKIVHKFNVLVALSLFGMCIILTYSVQ